MISLQQAGLSDAGLTKRINFIDRYKDPSCLDEWDTTYKTFFARGFKPPVQRKLDYESPYKQRSALSQSARVRAEQKMRVAVLREPSIVLEPAACRDSSDICGACSGDHTGARTWTSGADVEEGIPCYHPCDTNQPLLNKSSKTGADNRKLAATVLSCDVCEVCESPSAKMPSVYSKDLPLVPRPALPPDNANRFVQLRAKDWKGISYPFPDPRFEPCLPAGLDAAITPSTLNPFKYCQRRRNFPRFNQCPNLPLTEKALSIPEAPGLMSLESKLSDRRWIHKRFPKPPHMFITRLW